MAFCRPTKKPKNTLRGSSSFGRKSLDSSLSDVQQMQRISILGQSFTFTQLVMNRPKVGRLNGVDPQLVRFLGTSITSSLFHNGSSKNSNQPNLLIDSCRTTGITGQVHFFKLSHTALDDIGLFVQNAKTEKVSDIQTSLAMQKHSLSGLRRSGFGSS